MFETNLATLLEHPPSFFGKTPEPEAAAKEGDNSPSNVGKTPDAEPPANQGTEADETSIEGCAMSRRLGVSAVFV